MRFACSEEIQVRPVDQEYILRHCGSLMESLEPSEKSVIFDSLRSDKCFTTDVKSIDDLTVAIGYHRTLLIGAKFKHSASVDIERLYLLSISILKNPDMSDMEDLQEIYQFAIRLGKDAGQLLLQSVKSRYGGSDNTHGQSQEFVEKANAVDLVTQVDEGEIFRCKKPFKNCSAIIRKADLINTLSCRR